MPISSRTRIGAIVYGCDAIFIQRFSRPVGIHRNPPFHLLDHRGAAAFQIGFVTAAAPPRSSCQYSLLPAEPAGPVFSSGLTIYAG